MKYLTIAIGIFVLASSSASQTPGGKDAPEIDGKKLLGKWKLENRKDYSFWAFTSDGILKVEGTKQLSKTTSEWKYTLVGNKLTLIHKSKKQDNVVFTIEQLTDRELRIRDTTGRLEKLERVKEEKK